MSIISTGNLITQSIIIPSIETDHKIFQIILAAGSPYFRSMFASGMEESRKREVELKQIDPLAFCQVIKFIYTGSLNISASTVHELFNQAQLFQV